MAEETSADGRPGIYPASVVASVPDRRQLFLDIVGLLLVCAAAMWAFVTSLAGHGDPMDVLALLSTLAVGAVAGRLLPGIAPAVVVGLTILLIVLNPVEFMGSDPGGYPFGYANAKGAYLVQAAGAALLVARTRRFAELTPAAVTAAVVFGAMPFLFDSIAAGTLGLALVLVGLASIFLGRARALLLGMALAMVFLVVFSTTLLIATSGRNSPAAVGEVVGDTLGERRRILWTDAISALRHDPFLGVGPGNFEAASHLARAEEDVRWVPSTFLEQGAEGGVLGLALMLAIFLWAFVRLLASDTPGPITAIALAALFAIAVHACMDYVLHYLAVPMAAAVLFGSATSSKWKKDT